jgi:hypothetical protein
MTNFRRIVQPSGSDAKVNIIQYFTPSDTPMGEILEEGITTRRNIG